MCDEVFLLPRAPGVRSRTMESPPAFKHSRWYPCSSRASSPDPEITKDDTNSIPKPVSFGTILGPVSFGIPPLLNQRWKLLQPTHILPFSPPLAFSLPSSPFHPFLSLLSPPTCPFLLLPPGSQVSDPAACTRMQLAPCLLPLDPAAGKQPEGR